MLRRFWSGLLISVAVAGCAPDQEDMDMVPPKDALRVSVAPGFVKARYGRSEAATRQARLAESLGARLDRPVVFVESSDETQTLAAVHAGQADIGIGRFSPREVDAAGLAPTAPVAWVEDLLVSTQDGPVVSFDDLRHVRLALTPYRESQLTADNSLPHASGVQLLAGGTSLESTLRGVAEGRYQATVADSEIVADAQRRGWQLRVVGPVAERRPVVWAVAAKSPEMLISVNDFLFAEQVLGAVDLDIECRDLPAIRGTRVLRLITRNAPATVTVDRGGLEGFEYDLVLSFARELGLRVELVLPPPGVDALEWLRQGYGDLAALHEPAPLDVGDVLVTEPYRWVDVVAVVAKDIPPEITSDNLGGLSVAGSAGVLSWVRPADTSFPPMALRVPGGGTDSLAALLLAARGKVFCAVVDEDTARLEIEARSNLRNAGVVVPNVGLSWLVVPGATELAERLDRFLARSRRNGLIRQLELNYFGGQGRWVPGHLPEVPNGQLTPFDDLLKQAGQQYGVDWRLLASLMYEESRFDVGAVGPGGSAGLFQFMPFTWRELGVTDPHNPGQSVDAGARYLTQLMEGFADLALADQVAMAVASYNVGPRHVFDARSLAEEMNLNRNRWRGNVETAMVLLDNPETARRFPAGVCRCRRAVGYTRRILRRYAAYRGEISVRTEVPED